MTILGIETATNHISIGCVADDKEVEISQPNEKSLCRDIDLLIKTTLEKMGVTLHALDGIGVSIGPGSFTGLRIGLAAAKGIAYGLKLPLIPVPTMDELAHQAPASAHPIVVIINSRKDEVYYTRFKKQNGHLQKINDEILIKVSELKNLLTEPSVVMGQGFTVHRDYLLRECAPFIIGKDEILPSAKSIARLGILLLNEKKSFDISRLEPLYICEPQTRKPSAT